MGTRIEAASALTSHGLRKPTARRLADAAARTCLAHAGREPGDVDMLINAGIYREDNMGEPALAALIQEDIGANLGQPPIGGHGTFSFDQDVPATLTWEGHPAAVALGGTIDGTYRACVAVDEDTHTLDLPRWVIPAGRYAVEKIADWEIVHV